jgi:hypothetical protein
MLSGSWLQAAWFEFMVANTPTVRSMRMSAPSMLKVALFTRFASRIHLLQSTIRETDQKDKKNI